MESPIQRSPTGKYLTDDVDTPSTRSAQLFSDQAGFTDYDQVGYPTNRSDCLRYYGSYATFCISYGTFLLFNTLNGIGNSVFNSTPGEISNHFGTWATPAGYTFFIWFVIFITLALALVFHGVVTRLQYKVAKTVFARTSMYFFSLSLLSLTVWLFTFDRKKIVTSLVLLLIGSFAAVYGTNRMLTDLQNSREVFWGVSKAYYILYLVAINFLSIYTTWSVCATLLNIGVVMQYWAESSPAHTQWLVCFCFMLASILYFMYFVSGEVKSRYHVVVRDILTPPAVLMWAAIGVILKNYHRNMSGSVLGLLIATCVINGSTIVCQVALRIKKNHCAPRIVRDTLKSKFDKTKGAGESKSAPLFNE
eukprot:GHVH01006517.1.p1 GENE.GHVH01006517.1~~GHVH01006517.1.p1  ORF type:complete len:363 (+),score=25.81 GHVH01006517.1:103-1191(+)